jgi:hypothetical protein
MGDDNDEALCPPPSCFFLLLNVVDFMVVDFMILCYISCTVDIAAACLNACTIVFLESDSSFSFPVSQ